jgi:demethylmenaquinone methyltransferase/2-methoxy-6-polyprenyl-1,4-benzoquinol methylase
LKSRTSLPAPAEKAAAVDAMFDTIAPRYDRLNRIISFRFDQGWRRYAVAQLGWEREPAGIYLDLCAGTMDFGATLAGRTGFRGRIVGADFVRLMLELGRHKSPRLVPVNADALDLPFPDLAFAGAMIGWGVRNLVDLDAGLAEVARQRHPGRHRHS